MKKTKLLAVIISSLMLAVVFLAAGCGNNDLLPFPSGTGSEISTEGLVAHWQFEALQGGVIRDLSGNDRDLSVVGSADFVPGVSGNAMRFDGNTALTMAPASYISSRSMSVSFWVNIAGFTPPYEGANIGFNLWQNTIIDVEGFLAAAGTPNLLVIRFIWDVRTPNNVSLSAALGGPTGPMDSSDSILTNATEDININEVRNQWIHVAVVIDDASDDVEGTVAIYLNGRTNNHRQEVIFESWGGDKIIGNTDQTPQYAARTTIGGWVDDNGFVRRGGLYSLDDMRIYTRALSSAEVANLATLYR